MDVAKIAEREARHEMQRKAAGNERPDKWKKRLSQPGAAMSAPENKFKWEAENKLHPPDDTEKAIIDLAVQGKTKAAIGKTLNLPAYVVNSTLRQNRIRGIIKQRQAARKSTIDNARDAAEVQALENLIASGEAISAAIEKIIDTGGEVEMVDKLLAIYQDMQDRVGFPIIKRTDSRSTHADLGNPIVARLLTQNQKFRSIDGGKCVEVLDADIEDVQEPSIEERTD